MSEKKFYIKPALESERTVLGALLLDNTLFVGLNQQLCAEDFDNDFHKEVFASICKLIAKHKKFDAAMVIDDLEVLESQQPYIYELANTCVSTANIKAHADIIREKSVQRQLIKVAEEIAEGCKDQKQEALAMLSKAEKKVLEVYRASLVHGCPYKERLVDFLKSLTEEMAESEMDEEYLRECIVEVNKAFVMTLDHFEMHEE